MLELKQECADLRQANYTLERQVRDGMYSVSLVAVWRPHN